MATHDYQCKDCGTKFEVSMGSRDVAILYCPKCKSPNVKKLWNLIPVLYRGNGFYSTDNKKGK